MKLPPPLTPGIHDFLGAAATAVTMSRRGAAAADRPPAVALRRVLERRERKGEERARRTAAAEVEAMAIACLRSCSCGLCEGRGSNKSKGGL